MENNGYGVYGYRNNAEMPQYSPEQLQNTEDNTAQEITYADHLKVYLPTKRYAHPLLVLGLLIVCFPVGLFVMLCFTKWGAFPKTLVTLFVLAVALAVYEILVAKQVLLLPSLIDVIVGLFTA